MVYTLLTDKGTPLMICTLLTDKGTPLMICTLLTDKGTPLMVYTANLHLKTYSQWTSVRLGAHIFCSHLDRHLGCRMQHSAHVSLRADSATTGLVPRLVIPPARLPWPRPLSDQGHGLGKIPVPSLPLLRGRCVQMNPSSQHTMWMQLIVLWCSLFGVTPSPLSLLLS